jgi:hypothetical protein
MVVAAPAANGGGGMVLPPMVVAAWCCHVTYDGGRGLPALVQAARAWPGVPPLVGGLFWQKISQVVFSSISLAQVVSCVKNSLGCTSARCSTILPHAPAERKKITPRPHDLSALSHLDSSALDAPTPVASPDRLTAAAPNRSAPLTLELLLTPLSSSCFLRPRLTPVASLPP